MPQGSDRSLSRLIRALASPAMLSLKHVWAALTTDERSTALKAWLKAAEDQGLKEFREKRQLLVGVIASELKGFRPTTILGWPVDRLCLEAARLHQVESRTVLEGVVLQHHLPRLERLQAPLMDAIGAKHERGMIDDVADALRGLDRSRIRDGALKTWRENPTMEMAVYLLALFTMYPREWAAIADVLPDVSRDLANGGPRSPDESTTTESQASQVTVDVQGTAASTDTAEWRAPTRQLVASERAKFTELDNQIILRVVASVQGIADAPDERELDNMLLEFVRLSATRHQSFFHMGLHDAMRRRPILDDLPATNRSRTRWYLAGYLSGLERQSNSERILEVFDEREEVLELGDSGEGPSALAAPIVAQALSLADRSNELLHFLSPVVLLNRPDISRLVLDYATNLTRAERYSEALPLLELLWTTLTEERGVDANFRAKVSRRLAQCLRERDQLESARDLLLGLVESEDAEHKAMALADLGLISAGVRRLADLRLPATADEACALAEALESGWDRFTEAESLDVSTSSHARYCKGMAALARREYSKAEWLLESAVTAFNRERNRYEPHGLLARAQFHLDVARCANVDSKPLRLERAAEGIVAALRAGEELPDRYASEVIAGLSLRADEGTIVLIERLIESGGSGLLDRLRNEDAAQTSVAVADAFSARVVAENRTSSERVSDCCTALRMFLLQRQFGKAATMLDQLEAFATEGIGEAEFSEVLARPEQISPIWELDDVEQARIRQFERRNDYGMAAHFLIEQFHRVVSNGGAGAHLRAEDILERVASYPNRGELGVDDLRRRLDGSSVEPEALPASAKRGVRVLVVGGNETQRQYDGMICLDYRERAPWLDVSFMHTGWSSNWGSYIEEFDRRQERVDAVVFIYLMRTELGRTLRKRCTRPWRGCGGKGRASIQRSIDAAAAAALA